jgi:glucokinase
VDVARGKVITSHQVPGWTDYPLVADLEYRLGVPVTLGNDADVAGLGEAHWGAGRGIDSLFYITVGSGIGGGFIQNGRIYRGVGIGAAEIGHLRPARPVPNNLHRTVEDWASGWGIQKRYQEKTGLALTVPEIARRANGADPLARETLSEAIDALAEGICSVIALLCPRRIVIGGGVSLLGDELFFAPLRAAVRARVFAPFADTLDLVPAALGEEVVLHGALTLAHQSAGSI